MNSERREKLISRIGAVKNKADLKTLLENAVRIHGEIDNPDIQKAIAEAQAVFARDAAAARKKAASQAGQPMWRKTAGLSSRWVRHRI